MSEAGTVTERVSVVDGHAHVGALAPQDIDSEYMRNEWHGASHQDLLKLMDASGVEAAILHNARHWSNRYLARVARESHGRLFPLFKLHEGMAHSGGGIESLQHAVTADGFRGLYYDPWPQSLPAFDRFHEREFDPLWAALEELDIPMAVVAYGADDPTRATSRGNWSFLWRSLRIVLDRHPRLKAYVVHGLFPGRRRPEGVLIDGRVVLPDEVTELLRDHEVYLDILPGYIANTYGPNDVILRAMFDTFGPERLIWGSEFTKGANLSPEKRNTLEQYRYQLGYLADRHPYMTTNDRALIHGQNARRLWRIGRCAGS